MRTLRVVETDPEVDEYVRHSQRWPDVVERVRPLLLDAGLEERMKWNKPCYGVAGGNVVIVQEMKDFLALMFFKGALLDDPAGILREQGPNSRSARRVELTSPAEVDQLSGPLRALVAQAVAVEEAGLEVGPAPALELAPELGERLAADPDLAAAFDALTPGRQREYNLHVAGAKQASTRAARVDRCVDRILEGKGLRDR